MASEITQSSQQRRAWAYGVQDGNDLGVNDGSRDDAPLLAAAYAAALAAGVKTLVLPVGDIYIKSRTTDTSYPYDYVVRVTTDDFTIVVPYGCTIYVTDAGPASNFATVFQLSDASTRSRNQIIGGGKFVHTLGYASNRWAAVIAPTASADCVMDNLVATGFGAPGCAAFDSSSANKGTMSNLKAVSCYNGIIQSSAQATANHKLHNLSAINCYNLGVGTSAGNNLLNNITVDSSAITTLANFTALSCLGLSGNTHIKNVWLKNGDAVGSGTSQGVILRNSSVSNKGSQSIDGLVVDGFATAVGIQGNNANPVIANFTLKNFTYGLWKSSSSSIHCADLTLRDGQFDTGTFGFLSGDGGGDTVLEGLTFMDNVSFVGTIGTIYKPTSGVIATARNCNPMPTLGRPLLANNAGMPKGLEYFDDTLHCYITYSGGTTVWYNGAGTSV